MAAVEEESFIRLSHVMGWRFISWISKAISIAHRQTGRQTDRYTNRQTDRQTDKQTDRQTDKLPQTQASID